jgi:hypothetical protein
MKRVHIIIAPIVLLTACTTVSTNRFKAFAELGRGFEGAVDKVIDEAATSNVDANSQELLSGRKTAPAERLADLNRHNDAIVEANRTYIGLKKQTALLSEYFTALGALASFDGESAIGASTTGLVNSLQALSPSLEGAKIGGAAVGDLLGAAAPLVVSGIKSAKLRAELRRNGPTISRQLDLQNALLSALAEDIASDQDVLSQHQLLEDVLTPYVEASSVPAGWSADRREILRQQSLAPAPAAEAAELSKKLKIAFVGLAEGRVEPGDLADYAADLSRLTTLIEMVAKPTKPGE